MERLCLHSDEAASLHCISCEKINVNKMMQFYLQQ
jgi:hypothetical protein